jgi:hypothetical protein
MAQRGAGGGRLARPAAGTFRTRLEITNRSGWVTREYRLLLLPAGGVRIAYAAGRVSYDLHFDPQHGDAACTCPAFDADGHCKHLDAVLALLEGLAQRLGRTVTGPQQPVGRSA